MAERFSRESAGRPAAGSVASSNPFDSLLQTRFDFAPRLGGLYNGAGDVPAMEPAPEPAPATPAESRVFPDDTLTPAPSPPDANASSPNAGLIVVRNLPAGSTLSAGSRLNDTSWALSPAEVRNVVVTLPGFRRGPITAEIEVFGNTGASTGTMSVEIREQKANSIAAPRRAKIYRPAGAKPVYPSQSKKAAIASAAAAQAAQNQPAQVGPTPAFQQLFPQLPFIPGPIKSAPSPNDTTSRQIMINLGAAPSVVEKDEPQKN